MNAIINKTGNVIQKNNMGNPCGNVWNSINF